MKTIDVQELKRLLDLGQPMELWDVRTDAARRLARIEPSRLLDQEGLANIEDLPRETPLYKAASSRVAQGAASTGGAGEGALKSLGRAGYWPRRRSCVRLA